MVADPSRSRSRRKQRRRLTGAEMEALLSDPATIEAWGSAAVDDERRKLEKRKKYLNRDVPSSTWAEHHWHDRDVSFPPGGDQTLMERCRVCDRFTPPNNLGSSGACDDCRLGAMTRGQLENLPSSPGCVVDFRGISGARKRKSAQ